jgi:2-isopropylmalate synthase
MTPRVAVFDTTLRDGEQSPGCSMNPAEKLRLARQIERLGVDVIEAGFPIASPAEVDAVKAVAAEVRAAKVAALCRAKEGDIVAAGEAVKGAARPVIHTFLATSAIHLKYSSRSRPTRR